ncbi:lipocalin family protein [Chryseobacterium sp.]|uniref:lipocalin family protein n=1 Tax=Chryseobacterium sp. TaxID=1871047 RepID=UPI0028A29A82|nr:lipocalin family protein [Chryseobacterium sp.]
MKKLIALILLLLMMNCHSQQKNKLLANNPKVKTGIEYFLGNWKFVEKNYNDGAEKKIYTLHECMKLYTWKFERINDEIYLTKNYFTGKDCSMKSSSGKILVKIDENSISYTDVDLFRNEKYKIISHNKFVIIYSDILNGKVREIEDVYERQ